MASIEPLPEPGCRTDFLTGMLIRPDDQEQVMRAILGGAGHIGNLPEDTAMSNISRIAG